jgi:hypothetical protein
MRVCCKPGESFDFKGGISHDAAIRPSDGRCRPTVHDESYTDLPPLGQSTLLAVSEYLSRIVRPRRLTVPGREDGNRGHDRYDRNDDKQLNQSEPAPA